MLNRKLLALAISEMQVEKPELTKNEARLAIDRTLFHLRPHVVRKIGRASHKTVRVSPFSFSSIAMSQYVRSMQAQARRERIAVLVNVLGVSAVTAARIESVHAHNE